MSDLIYFDAGKPIGSSASAETSGDRIQYVEPEIYFPALLGEVMNASVVFLHAHAPGALPDDKRQSVDDAIAEAYWDVYEGCLMPDRVLRLLLEVSEGPSGQMLLQDLEEARVTIMGSRDVEEAANIHATFRIQMLEKGAEHLFTERQASAGEFLSDYLLVQRGVAHDIRRAEEEREEGDTRASVLSRLDRSADLQFEKLLGRALHPKHVYRLVPRDHRAVIEEFAKHRTPFHSKGILPAAASQDS